MKQYIFSLECGDLSVFKSVLAPTYAIALEKFEDFMERRMSVVFGDPELTYFSVELVNPEEL